MRFLILNAEYPKFLHWLYTQHVGLERLTYEEQMRASVESLFGLADFYSSNLRRLGHEAYDVHTNNEMMQKAWAREHEIAVEDWAHVTQPMGVALRRLEPITAANPLRYLRPFVRPLARAVLNKRQRWFYDILAAQIESYRPDVLLNLPMDGVNSRFLREMKPHVQLLVGLANSPLKEGEDWGVYDLVVSPLPNFVEHFRRLSIPSEPHCLAFEPGVLSRLENGDHTIPVSFVGSLSSLHQARAHWLEHLCSSIDIQVWGPGVDKLSPDSPIGRRYVGSAWGVRMYEILRASKITVNHHGRVAGAERYAANMRLFEATGVGTLLVTDWKENLHKMFEPGKEVVAFRSPEECGELVRYYLEHDNEREAIARAGQQRTLREHTYYHRAQELVEIVRKYL